MGRTSSTVKDRYNAKVYDEIKVRVPKGRKEALQAHAAANGESLNGFVNTAIDERVARLQGTQEQVPLIMGSVLVFQKVNNEKYDSTYVESKTGVKYKVFQSDSEMWEEPLKAELWLNNLFTEYQTGIKYNVIPYKTNNSEMEAKKQ